MTPTVNKTFILQFEELLLRPHMQVASFEDGVSSFGETDKGSLIVGGGGCGGMSDVKFVPVNSVCSDVSCFSFIMKYRRLGLI